MEKEAINMEQQKQQQSPYKTVEKKIRACQHLSEVLEGDEVLDFLDPEVVEKHADVLFVGGMVKMSGEDKPFFAFHEYEGLFVIPDCLPVWQQIEIAHFALSKTPGAPNNTNLTPSEVEEVWEREKQLYDAMGPDTETYRPLPKANVLGRLRWASLGFQYDWTNRRYPQAKAVEDDRKINDCVDKGSNIDETKAPPQFPPRLATIIRDIVELIPVEANIPSCTPITMEPEASIVNFFPAGTTMGGHVDDAELTYDHPVVSLSLGKTCVFLIGGLSKDATVPLAMILRSGYVLVMHGKSRLRMHGVAKVFPCPCGDTKQIKKVPGAAKKWSRTANTLCECKCSSFDEDLEPSSQTLSEIGQRSIKYCCHEDLGGVECGSHSRSSTDIECTEEICAACSRKLLPALEIQRVLKYLKTSRLNINVRQVYATGTRPSHI